MDNEDFVRTTWKVVSKRWKDNDSYAPDLFIIEVGNETFSDPDYRLVWEKAATYTKAVLTEFSLYKEAKKKIQDMKPQSEIDTSYLSYLLQRRFSELFYLLKDEIVKEHPDVQL